MDVLTPGEIPGEREAVEDMKRNRVAGYTFELLRADLHAYGAAGEMPNHRQWIYRTVGLLLLKPETCAELAKAWSEPGLSDGAHNLIVDVLANAGSAEAQKALRDILGSEQAWKDNNFQRLVQSMTLLREPNVESVAFLESLSTTVKQPAGQAAAVISLGSGIGKLYARGEVQEAEKFNRTIRRLAQSASTSGQKQGVLYAIGNTGMDSNLSLLGDFISSPDDNIRATSARALRNFKGGDARSSLRLMTVDPSPLVQREAIRALRNNGISTEDVGALLAGVRSGEIDTSTLPGLMRALSTSLKEGVNSGIMLDALRSRAGGDRDLLRQINELAMELQR
jgi:HEAT repeat protein